MIGHFINRVKGESGRINKQDGTDASMYPPLSDNNIKAPVTNAVAIADGKANFRAAVKRGLDDLGLRLIHLKEAETLKTRLSKHSISEDLERTADEVKNTGEVGFGTFHTFDAE